MIQIEIIDNFPVVVKVDSFPSSVIYQPQVVGDFVETVTGTYVNNTDPFNPVVDVSLLENRIQDIEEIVLSQSNFTGYAYAVWTGAGLVFDVFWPAYYIQGTRYESGSGQVTLDSADPTNPRLDVIAVDSTGAISITGNPAVDPVKPTIDPLTQLEITTVFVGAGATEPGITNEDVYIDGSEWTESSNNGSVDFLDTSNPYSGTYNIDCGTFDNTHYIKFVDGSTHNKSTYGVLKFSLYLKSLWSGGLSPTYIKLRFLDGADPISDYLSITSGKFNFLRTLTDEYQVVVVPISSFTFTDSIFDTIEFTFNGTNPEGFNLDEIVLQTGSVTVSPLQNAIVSIETDSGVANADVPDDTIQITGAGGIETSASGKIITITQGEKAFTDLTDVPANYTGHANKQVTVKATEDGLEFTVQPDTGVQTVTGDGVDNTDADNPILSFPIASEVEFTPYGTIAATDVQGAIEELLDEMPSGSGHTIQDEGTPLTQRTNLNFVGSAVTVTDDSGGDATVVTISASVYTDEQAQDAVGTILADTNDIDFTYNDGTPSIEAALKKEAITSKTNVTPASGDSVLISDVSDSDNLKKSTVGAIVALGISDTAYDGSWNGVTDVAPSKNAVYDQMELKAPLASPALTGTPTAPTAAVLTNTTQLATTAFVQQEIYGSNSYIANKISLLLFNSY